MAAERLTVDAVTRALQADDQAAADAVAGEIVCNLGFVRMTVASMVPREWEAVAAYLYALLARAPIKGSSAYEAHRMVLGMLALELRTYAQQAGEPVGLEADLRAASSQAEEQHIRARMADQAAARDRQLTEIELEQAAYHAHMRPDPAEEENPIERIAAPSPENVDVDAWT